MNMDDRVCPNCHRPVQSGERRIADEPSYGRPVSRPTEPPRATFAGASFSAGASVSAGNPSSAQPLRNSNLVLAENEQIVRQYRCVIFKYLFFFTRSEGILTVTNKRVLFHGRDASSWISKEIVLDSVSGMNCYSGINVNALGLILGVVLALYGFILLYGPVGGVALPVFLLLLGIFFIAISIRKTFSLSIYSSKATGAPISIGEGIKTVLGNSNEYSLRAVPTNETERMLSELGALIQDLQTLGDHAIEKWHE